MSPTEEPLSIAGVRFVTGQMPFLSPTEQCQSTEGTKARLNPGPGR